MGGVSYVAGTRIPVAAVVGLVVNSSPRLRLSVSFQSGSAREVPGRRVPPTADRRITARAAGHGCSHVYELGLGSQPDEQIMALADRDNRPDLR